MNKAENKSWLLMDNRNFIRGPLNREEVLSLFQNRKINQNFFLSKADGFWFSVGERDYLMDFFPEIEEIEKKLKAEEEKKEAESKKIRAENTKKAHSVEIEAAEEITLQIQQPDELSKKTFLSKIRLKGGFSKINKSFSSLKIFLKNTKLKIQASSAKRNNATATDLKTDILKSKEKIIYSILVISTASIIIIISILAFKYFNKKTKIKNTENTISYEQVVKNIKMNFLVKDFSKAKRNIAMISNSKNKDELNFINISKTMIEKELLFNIDASIKISKDIDLSKIKDQKKLAEIHNLLGIYHMELKNKQKARAWLKKSMEAMPDEAVYQINFANSLLLNGDAEKAKNILHKVIQNSETRSSIQEYALTLLASIDKENSKDYYEKILELNPSNGEAKLHLALIYRKKLKLEKAKNYMIDFINFLPVSTESRLRNFRLFKLEPKYSIIQIKIREIIAKKRDPLLIAIDGILSTQVGKFLHAKKLFQESLKIENGNLYAIIGLAYKKLKEENSDEIANILLEARKKHKDNFALNALIGISYLKENQFFSAKKYFDPLLKSHGYMSQTWAWMAQVNLGLKNKKEAASLFQKSIKINPYDSMAVLGLVSMNKPELLNIKAINDIFPF